MSLVQEYLEDMHSFAVSRAVVLVRAECMFTIRGRAPEAAKLFLNVMPTFTATELVEFKDTRSFPLRNPEGHANSAITYRSLACLLNLRHGLQCFLATLILAHFLLQHFLSKVPPQKAWTWLLQSKRSPGG